MNDWLVLAFSDIPTTFTASSVPVLTLIETGFSGRWSQGTRVVQHRHIKGRVTPIRSRDGFDLEHAVALGYNANRSAQKSGSRKSKRWLVEVGVAERVIRVDGHRPRLPPENSLDAT